MAEKSETDTGDLMDALDAYLTAREILLMRDHAISMHTTYMPGAEYDLSHARDCRLELAALIAEKRRRESEVGE